MKRVRKNFVSTLIVTIIMSLVFVFNVEAKEGVMLTLEPETREVNELNEELPIIQSEKSFKDNKSTIYEISTQEELENVILQAKDMDNITIVLLNDINIDKKITIEDCTNLKIKTMDEKQVILNMTKHFRIFDIVNSEVFFENILFTTTTDENFGGGLTIRGSTVTFKYCNFKDNSAIFGGGALTCGNSSNVELNDCLFVNNKARDYGGAILCENYNESPLAKITIKNSQFKNNKVFDESNPDENTAGGAFFSDGYAVNIEGAEFISNEAFEGGAICAWDTNGFINSKIDIYNSVFKDNKATLFSGGALLVDNMTLNAKKTLFEGNSAKENGGAIQTGTWDDDYYKYSITHDNLKLSECSFKGNQAGTSYQFNSENTELKTIYETHIKDTKELSKPFSLDSALESMTYAYNNSDIAYIEGEKLIQHSISFDANTGDGEVPKTMIVFNNEDVKLPVEEMEITKPGHKFIGWSEDEKAEEATYTVENNTLIMPNKDMTLYAVWEINTYTITIVDEDGSQFTLEEVEYGKEISIETIPTKEKDDQYTYEFESWIPQGDYTLENLKFVDQDMVFMASYKATEIKTPVEPKPEPEPNPDPKPMPKPNPESEGEVLGESKDEEKEISVSKGKGTVETMDTTNVLIYVVLLASTMSLLLIKKKVEE